jgi:hypothetical protein
LSRYSQSDEDEIIETIFHAFGEGGKRFVEFGCGDGRQNNSISLLHRGWHGTWIEPHRKRNKSAQERFSHYPVEIIRRIITPRNVNKYVTDPLDFLSIDIDGNDYAVWAAVEARPRVVCIEYDAVNGSTLEAIRGLAVAKDYLYITTSASQVNAFFVANK